MSKKLRRLQEEIVLNKLKTRWSLGMWDSRTAAAMLWHHERAMGGADDDDTVRLRTFAEGVEVRHGVTVRRNATEAGFTNAYAYVGEKVSERADILTVEDALTAAHEAMHIAHPCETTHRRVASGEGRGTVCVLCELTAWKAVLAEVPCWPARAHILFSSCLGSYAPYATRDERVEINRLISRGMYQQIQHRLAVRQLEQDGILGGARRARAETARRLKQHAEMMQED